jgi:hypothetical protein
MAVDKYDFIQEVLSTQTMNSSQREKLLKLTSDEIKKDKKFNITLEERVLKLEKIILSDLNNLPIYQEQNVNVNKKNISNISSIDEEIDNINSLVFNNSVNPSLPDQYIDPSNLYKYLLAYNQDPILKSTCHLIDSSELEKINEYCNTDIYNFNLHYNKILESFNKINKQFAPAYIKALIRGYLTGRNYNGEEIIGWSDDKIKWSWNDQGLKNWSNQNMGIPPNPDIGLSNKIENNGFEFGSPIKIKEGFLQSLSDMVVHFKKMFHIREDNSLFSILQKQNTYRKWEDKIDFIIEKQNFPENIEFFTDIDKLLQCYNEIIQLSIDFAKNEKPLINLKLFEKDNSIYFSIHDLNAVYGKSLISAKNRLIGQKYEAIIKKLNGVCNFYLQANFGQEVFSKLTIWDSESNVEVGRMEQKVDTNFKSGVEHILELKRR